MQFALRETEQELADALLITLGTLMLLVGLNAQSMQTVHQTRHAQDYTVLTLVQGCVEQMPSAELSTTSPHAPAIVATQEILSHPAEGFQYQLSRLLHLLTHVIPILVDQTATHQDRLVKDASVHVLPI